MVVSTPEKDRALEDLHTIAFSLERIADALEDIAIEVKRPHEVAMEQQRRRCEQYENRTFSAISSERGRGV